MTLREALRVSGGLLVAPLLLKMSLLRLGVEKELERAECGERIHCLVFVVALDGDSLSHSLRHLHLVIGPRSYQVRPIKFTWSKLFIVQK